MTTKTKTTTTKGNKARAAAKPTEPTVPAVLAADANTEAKVADIVTDAQKATIADVTAHVRATLETAAAAFNDVAQQQATLNTKREGGYVTCLRAAREAGSVDVLSNVWDSLKADIRADVSGIGKRLHCTLGKPDKDGKTEYKVPGSLSTAMSVILGAMRAGVKLTGKDGKELTFGEVRAAKAEADKAEADAKAKAALASASPAEKARAEIARLARLIADGAANFTEKEALETVTMLQSIYATMDGSAGHAKPTAAAKAA